MDKLQAFLQQDLEERKQQSLYRSRHTLQSAQSSVVTVDGRALINFSSNDYLGLANHPDIKQAFVDAVDEVGVGSGSAHLICGHSHYHHKLENALAEFTGRDRALLFSTGYMANLAIAQALSDKNTLIVQDKLNHASMIDAAKLSSAKSTRYLHSDVDSLQSRLISSHADTHLVMTDSVFSMDGDIAPLPELVETCAEHQAWLMVDDAHGFGVLGETGAGSLQHFSLSQQQVPILMATLGKAFGTTGAFVAGSEALIETLIQKARTYIYTTATPPAVAAATLASLKIVRHGSALRQQLADNIHTFRSAMQQTGLQILDSETAIQGVVLGSNEATLSASRSLYEAGFLVTAIRPPTVPMHSARLRITLSASHSEGHIEGLVKALSSLPKARL